MQTKRGGLNFVVAGVNPSIAEENRFGEHQNPLFGIVTPIFLGGMVKDEMFEMVQKIGKIMGISMTDDALHYLYDQYSGHPLLTRLACSNVAEIAKGNQESFPLRITSSRLRREQKLRDSELVFYVRHIVDELERFYPQEYALLESLATDDYQAFTEATNRGHWAAHLFRYGVVSNREYPYITYSVLKDYVALENARREGRRWRYRLVEP